MSFWDQLVQEFESLGTTLAEWLPRLVVALLILVIGGWIIKWVRKLTVKLLNVGWIDGIFDRAGINKALEPSDQNAAGITATVLYAYLYVVLWLMVFRVLQIHSIEALLESRNFSFTAKGIRRCRCPRFRRFSVLFPASPRSSSCFPTRDMNHCSEQHRRRGERP